MLVVDDDAGVRMICREVLERAGYIVRVAVDGTSALEEDKLFRPDLILLDIMMPQVSGWDVAAQILSEPSTNAIPIVFISALTGLHERKRAADLGAFGYVGKPLDPAALAQTVTDVLDRIERGDRESLLSETFGRSVG